MPSALLRAPLLICFLVVGGLALAGPAGAQGASYQIPCQARGAFVSRLRSLVRQPDAVEVALTRFSIVVRQEAGGPESPWTLVVTRTGDDHEPRSVRDRSCEAVAEAAALVVSVWIDEVPLTAVVPPSAAAPPPPPTAAPTPATVEVPVEGDGEAAQTGLALALENASHIAPHWSVGASLELWLMQRGGVLQHNIGFTTWPTAYGLRPAPAGSLNVVDVYDRPVFEMSYVIALYLLRIGPIAAGAWGSFSVGVRPLGTSYGASARFGIGLPVRWHLGGPWHVYVRVGTTLDDAHISFLGTTGLSWTAF